MSRVVAEAVLLVDEAKAEVNSVAVVVVVEETMPPVVIEPHEVIDLLEDVARLNSLPSPIAMLSLPLAESKHCSL